MGTDNASRRILSPRTTTQGHDNSLQNTFGRTLLDGAQCYVTGEQANYRFLHGSVLHADGKFVVEPVDHSGRWVRECGTFGMALLKNGRVSPGDEELPMVGSYTQQLLVQFALNGAKLIYTGAVQRIAYVVTSVTSPAGAVPVVVIEREGEKLLMQPAEPMALLHPGDCISVHLSTTDIDARGSLTVALG